MGVTEAPNNTKEEYLQLHFISYLNSERITVFEASVRRSNAVVQMSQHLPRLNLPVVEGVKSSYMSGFADTVAGLNLVNIEYHQSVAERHPNLVFKFVYLKDMEYVDPFNISGVDRGKEIEQVNGRVDVTSVITYKTLFVLNRKLVTVSLTLG